MNKTKKFNFTYNQAKNHLEEVLKIESDIQDTDNLLELGLSSLDIMIFAGKCREKGSQVTFAQLISSPYLGKWWDLIENGNAENSRNRVEVIQIDMHTPFALTDVQYAYWIGRCPGQYLGNVGCHGYMEFEGEGVDPDKLSKAWSKLQQHHPMLRSKFSEEGQVILKEPKNGDLIVHDLREKEQDVVNLLQEIRNRLSHRVLKVEDGQVAGLQIAILPNEETRIFFDIDLLVADVTSFQIILRDLVALYVRNETPKAPTDWNFAEYLHKEKTAQYKTIQRAKKYWIERLKNLPGAPELPLSKNPEEIKKPTFKRRQTFIKPQQWEKLKSIAASYKITPAMVLLTLYGRVIHRWSENNKFLLNLPLFNRESEAGNVDNVVADFTALLLVEMDFKKPLSFLEQAYSVQEQFHENMKYVAYSAIQIQRDYLRLHPGTKTLAPVVFSYNVGIPLINQEFQESLGNMTYMVSQTPQVWLDFQLYDLNQGLLLVWDGIDEIFPKNTLDDMFKAYEETLTWLIEKESHWNQVPYIGIENQLAIRDERIELDKTQATECIHASFFTRQKETPDQVALIDPAEGIELTYGELSRNALAISQYLLDQGIERGEKIAISLDRNYHQIEAILGILAAGCVYVPIATEQPKSRKEIIYTKASIRFIIVDKNSEKDGSGWVRNINIQEALETKPLSSPVLVTPKESAYIIFTSGSTGEPKGVEVSHGAAFNTINDINKKYQICSKDRALTVSAIDFDLSVYDIFGLLGVGGSLVLISHDFRREASEWLKLMQKYKITIWNSVPVLYDMLLLEAKGAEISLHDCRLVLLSGDWIGLDLPIRQRAQMPKARMIAMGGATEGSIWSNYYEVQLPLPQNWQSIPYGYPLTNQKYRIADSWNEDCPDYVSGELWIGGDGVAKGYIGSPEQTEESFVCYNHEKWYKTGDFGRYWVDGTIEFLGRKDQQVKIRGHRIELEEIERATKTHPQIQQAVVLSLGEGKNKSLVGFIIPEHKENNEKSHHIFKSIFSDTNNCLALSKNLNKLATDFCKREEIEEKSLEAFRHYEKRANELSLFHICQMLVKIKAPAKRGDRYRLKEIYDQCHIATRYHSLVQQWYLLLSDSGVIEQLDVEYYKNTKEFTDIKEPDCEDRVLKKFIHQFTEKCSGILKGKIDPLRLVFTKGGVTPNTFSQKTPGADQKNRLGMALIKESVKKISESKEQVRILEIGARSLEITEDILSQLANYKISYTCSDTSIYFEEQVGETLNRFPDVNYQKFNPNEDPCAQKLTPQDYDIIIANNTLHQAYDLNKTLTYLQELLSPGGILVIMEITQNTPIESVGPGFLADGFSHFQDIRKGRFEPLLKTEEWKSLLFTAGFEVLPAFPSDEYKLNCYHQHLIVGIANSEKKKFESENLKAYLREKLPDYMVPSEYFILHELPITINGKIDRKNLSSFQKGTRKPVRISQAPQSELEITVLGIWEETLQEPQISLSDNFYDLGGDSLLATQLIVKHKKKLNIDLKLETIFKYPVLADFIKALESKKNPGQIQTDDKGLPTVVIRAEDRFKPFPLTDIQQSYWLGRSGLYSLGKVSTHCYFEMECEILNIVTLNKAWNRLIQAHPMMRAIILQDGQSQVVKETVPEYEICLHEIDSTEEIQINDHLTNVRKEMSHQTFDPSVWPLFDVQASKFNLSKMVIHISFDNIIFDGFSMFHLFGEWNRLYKNLDDPLPPQELTFRDYVLTVEEIKKSPLYKKDLAYWRDRATQLPAAPALPLAKQPDELTKQEFTRFETKLSPEKWQTFQELVGRHHLTPAVVLMTAYSEVLGAYSKSQNFTLNLTRFARLDLHPEVSELIGDFSSLTLLEVDNRTENSFMNRCQKVQKQLWQDLDHPYVSGIEVEREIKKLSNRNTDITMPVVFTSGIGVNKGSVDPVSYFGKIVYGISQTPQVWIDHQVSEQEGGLVLSWDALCELFPEGMIEEMFEVYKKIIHEGITNEKIWLKKGASLVSVPRKEIREQANDTQYSQSSDTLLSLFEDQLKQNGLRAAIITTEKTLTYDELNRRANFVAELLIQQGVEAHTLVAVVMEKGWEQIVAVIAILKVNAAYMPVDASNPQGRIHKLLDKGSVGIVLTQSKCEPKLHSDIKSIAIDLLGETDTTPHFPKPKPADLAYVIFTSGSTGQPKGVMIDHKGAVNTLKDINRRFNVNEKDRAFALSNVNFDLSVYDIFGLLAVGGGIVIPDSDKVKNPHHWVSLIKKHQITVWNTVPMFMEMLVEHLVNETDSGLKHSLKLVLLSGDWIPLDLPDRIRELFHEIEIIGLGGATEASIWSNFFRIGKIDPKWKSIPYGKPLANQRFYILNELMEDCPIWVPGELYIGGQGVALGYWDEKEKTEESFISHPKTGEKIYKTGDLGRYFPDGNIEFLGRTDLQVKVGGHRIELGEIETNIKALRGIKDVVVTLKKDSGKPTLVGHLVLDSEGNESFTNTIISEQGESSSTLPRFLTAFEENNQELEKGESLEEMGAFSEAVEILSTAALCHYISGLELCKKGQDIFSLTEILEIGNITNRYQILMESWLERLVEKGILIKTKNRFQGFAGLSEQVTVLKKKGLEKPSWSLQNKIDSLWLSLYSSQEICVQLLQGRLDPVELFQSQLEFLTPKKLGKYNIGQHIMISSLSKAIEIIVEQNPDKTFNILELGTRIGQGTKTYAKVTEGRGTYTYSDESLTFLNKKQQEVGESTIAFKQFDHQAWSPEEFLSPHSFDIILAENTLHRSKDLHKSLENLKKLLKPEGLLVFSEITENATLLLATVAFFEDGFKDIVDERAEKHLPLLSLEKWDQLLKEHHFGNFTNWPSNDSKWGKIANHFMVAQAPNVINEFLPHKFVEIINEKVPDYMVPQSYSIHKKFPITGNGKIDRNHLALQEPEKLLVKKSKRIEPKNKIQNQLSEIWGNILQSTPPSITDNFFEHGGDSLKAIQFVNTVKETCQYDLALDDLFSSPSIQEISQKIEQKLSESKTQEEDFETLTL